MKDGESLGSDESVLARFHGAEGYAVDPHSFQLEHRVVHGVGHFPYHPVPALDDRDAVPRVLRGLPERNDGADAVAAALQGV